MIKVTKAAAAIICLTRLGMGSGFSQVSAEANVYQYLENKISNIPASSSNVYEDPTEGQIETWKEAFLSFVDGEYAVADGQFSALGYRIVNITDTETGYQFYIIEKQASSSNYWGTYAFNPKACRPNLVLQSPHPKFDSNTGSQGAYSFLALNAGSFFLSGVHRCNSAAASECSGTTSACGSNAAFRISDPAHNDQGIFHIMTELVLESNPASVFVQYHGFGKDSGDPNAILSNGTRETPTTDYIHLILREMESLYPSLSYKVIHKDISWTKLTAFTNTQGRLINESQSPCIENATAASGRFIHIEQERAVFRDDAEGWDKWVKAMSLVFQCESEALGTDATHTKLYPNPIEDCFTITGLTGTFTLQLINSLGQKVFEVSQQDWSNVNIATVQPGMYVYRLIDHQGKIIDYGKLVKN
ncbi:MAG: T9SS type A sorting domain-containing protein [Marinoscillum sp.]